MKVAVLPCCFWATGTQSYWAGSFMRPTEVVASGNKIGRGASTSSSTLPGFGKENRADQKTWRRKESETV